MSDAVLMNYYLICNIRDIAVNYIGGDLGKFSYACSRHVMNFGVSITQFSYKSCQSEISH